MEATRIRDSNGTLKAPEGWDEAKDGHCEPLHVRVLNLPPGGTAVIESAWRPTDDEMALLNAGGSVILRIFGNGMMPVQLYVEGE